MCSSMHGHGHYIKLTMIVMLIFCDPDETLVRVSSIRIEALYNHKINQVFFSTIYFRIADSIICSVVTLDKYLSYFYLRAV